ncbi:MAG: bifunctional adenosylcobinamide kinase/adenosylcobinamide-phosphate guanylyltransferase [Pseudomonadota bacterium]
MKTLILGGVRSGKTRLAQTLAAKSGLAVTYIATARAGDVEMAQRIAAHKAQRPAAWALVEEPLALARALAAHDEPGRCLIVDCLTLWLSNVLTSDRGRRLDTERDALLAALPYLTATLILVGNETNMGVIPLGALSRRFCDLSGELHQALARLCDRVVLTVAGLPHALKGGPLDLEQ